jgi:hypothetical protein
MKPYFANLINSIVLVILGTWGYFGSDIHSPTAMIPVFIGILLLALTPSFKKGNKIIAHIAVTIALIILVALIKPLIGSIGRHNSIAVFRVSAMMLSSLIALIVFIKSFVDARIKSK